MFIVTTTTTTTTNSCTPTQVAFSNKAAAGSISGETDVTVTVTCDAGYTGGGTATCGTSGTFNDLTCSASICTPTEVAFSNKAAAGSISGTTTAVVNVTCNAGYTGGGNATCGTGGTFNTLTCSANSCTDNPVVNLTTFKGAQPNCSGTKNGQSCVPKCNAGYFSTGNW